MSWRRGKTPTKMAKASNTGALAGFVLVALFAAAAISERDGALGLKLIERTEGVHARRLHLGKIETSISGSVVERMSSNQRRGKIDDDEQDGFEEQSKNSIANDPSMTEYDPTRSLYNSELAKNYWKRKLSILCEGQEGIPTDLVLKTANSSRIFLPAQEQYKQSICTMKRRVTFEDYWATGPRNSSLQDVDRFTHPSLQIRMGDWTTRNKGTYRLFAGTHDRAVSSILVHDSLQTYGVRIFKCASESIMAMALKLGFKAIPFKLETVNQWPARSNYVKWTFVREPIDRFVSAYITILHRLELRAKDDPEFSQLMLNSTSFFKYNKKDEPLRITAFINDLFNGTHGNVKNGFNRIPFLYPDVQHIYTQSYFLSTSMKQHPLVDKIDFVGRVENFREDWNKLLSFLEQRYKRQNNTDSLATSLQEARSQPPATINARAKKAVTKNDLTDDQMRLLCEVYMQDYLSFNYELPAACLARES